MIVSCVALLSSCGKDDDDKKADKNDKIEEEEEEVSIEGKWTAEIDLKEFMGEDLGEIDIDELPVELILEFGDDGNFDMTMSADKAIDVLYDVLVEMLGGEDAMEAFLEESGTTKEDFVGEMIGEIESESMKGVYELDGDKLYLGEDKIEKGNYAVIELSAKKLVLKEVVGAEDEDLGGFAEMLPLTFKK